MLERLARPAHSDSRNRKHCASNQILHASPRPHSLNLRDVCRPGEPGRGNAWSGAEENLFVANPDSSSKKENHFDCHEKEIADAHAKSVVVSEEKTFAGSEGRRIPATIAELFSEKETHTREGRGNAKPVTFFIAAQKESVPNTARVARGIGFAKSERERFAPSKEKRFANPVAVGNACAF